MKNRYLIVGLFAIVLALGVMCFNSVNDDVVYATEEGVESATPEGVDYIVEKHKDISAYRTKNTDGYYKSPSVEKTTTAGEWVFAGWYTSAACSQTVAKSSGEAYAKFVSADVLSVKCQISTDTQLGSASTLLRCISSVDTLKYSKVGFDLITPTETKNMEGSTVGTRIQVTEDKASNPCNYSPKVVDTESEYFYSAVEEIQKDDFYDGFLVKPYWITKDGTKVYGVSKYVVIADALNQSAIYIPVKKSTEPTSETVFTVSESSVESVKYDADGGYAHLKYTDSPSTLGSVTKFQITGGDAATTVYYRNLNTKYTGTNADQSWYTAYDAAEDEYVIATSADLYGMSVLANPTNKITFKGKTIYLCADIEANKGEIINDTWDKTQVENGTDYMWTPIGRTVGDQDGAVFNGIFDGQGHTISGLYAELTTVKCNDTGTENGTALFAWTDSSSVLKNFQLVNSYLGGTTYNASIVSRAEGNINNVDSDAIVKGSSYINGGIVANTYGEIQIKDCNFTGNVTSGTNFAGGIVGTRKRGDLSIINCTSQGTVCAPTYYSGGILGGIYDNLDNATITVENCRFTGNLENTSGHSGGIIGSAYDKKDIINVTKCSVEGTINAGHYSGGFIGQIGGGSTTIKESDFAGELIASNYVHVGGFVGKVIGGSVAIDNSNFKETGKLVASETAGGLVGYVTGGTVKIDGSSFAGEVASTWCNGGLVSRVATGTVEIKNSSFEETGKLTKGNYLGGFIGRVESGTVNIDACCANSMTAQGSYSGGIIGYVGGGNATVKNTYFQGAFNTTAQYAGGLVGYIFKGTLEIEKSYFDGDFTSTTNYAGGIVGTIGAVSSGCDVTVDIKSCYAKGTVSAGGSHIGGIVGSVTYLTNKVVSLTDCLNAASVSGGNWTGGLFGRTHKTSGTIKMTRCLNMGAINSSSSTSAGSAVGGADQAPTVETVYAVINNAVSKACGNNTIAVTTCELKDITIGNGVTAEKIQTETLKDLFATEDSIWTIGTTEGSTPKLDLTK